jgi:hypothetical protein
MKLTQLLAAATLTVSSMCAFATPIYSGDTDASGFSNSQLSSGYTIWNSDTSPSDWHLRWTSKGANSGNNVSWFGNITFYNSLLDPYNSASQYVYQWETNTDTTTVYEDSPLASGGDVITWSALTNDTGGVDGINFSLKAGVELLQFNLGSSLFAGLATEQTHNGTDATMITIGDQADALKVNVSSNNSGTYQHLQVNVSEPGTLALFGLGLAGLGFARRKQA